MTEKNLNIFAPRPRRIRLDAASGSVEMTIRRQNRMVSNDDREKGVCPYRGSQTLVQGRSRVRTGEIEPLYSGDAALVEWKD